jgi:uncharacterized membrane protein YfcA
MILENNVTKYALIIAIGFVSGILQGSLGSVGVIVIIPALLAMNIVGDYKTACGTLLITLLFPTSLLGLYEYYKTNSLALITGIILTITMTIGGYYGSLVTNYVTYGTLEIISGVIFFIIGMYYFFMGSHSLYTKEIRNKTIWF